MKNIKKNGYPVKGFNNFVVPPNIQAQISGADLAWQDTHGRIGLRYIDGTQEETPINQPLISSFDNHFNIVSFVQGFKNEKEAKS